MGHKVDWAGLPARIIDGTPAWALAATASAVLVTLLLVGYLTWSRLTARQAQRELHQRELLALAQDQGTPVPAEPVRMDPKPLLGGIAVSLYGLWGFARGTIGLPMFFAVGFVSMFDVLELRLFSLMYKAVNRDQRWTPQLRLLQATAWSFVAASALANIAHAPNALAAPFMALMPVGAAWVIELDLRRALAGKEPEEKPQQGTKPGPFRLVGLLWRRLWAWGFRKAGLDVTDRADEMVRRARARDAADASYALRKALKERERLETVVKDADVPRRGRGKLSPAQQQLATLKKELETKIRPRAQAALEMADTQDPEQGLQLMQRMAWLTRADDVALLDYGPDSPAMEVLQQLNIAANADFVAASKRAAEVDARAAEVEQQMQAAKDVVKAAEERLEQLEKQIEQRETEAAEAARETADSLRETEAEREREAERVRLLREEQERLASTGASAEQRIQEAAERIARLEGQLEKLQGEGAQMRTDFQAERDKLAGDAERAREDARKATEQLRLLEGEQRALKEQLAAAEKALAEQAAAVAARQKNPRVRVEQRLEDGDGPRPPENGDAGARGGSAEETRRRLRELMADMSPEELEPVLSRRKVAEVLAPKVGLGPDAVRGHLKVIAEEDAKKTNTPNGDVPGPRSEELQDAGQ